MSDVSQVHQTEHQKLAPMKDEDNEESESIKEEQEEYFITVGKLHIEEQQRPLIKGGTPPSLGTTAIYVKEEGIDVPMCTVEPLRSEDECPSGASSGAEPLSCSSSTASFQADNLAAPPPVSRDATSHLQFRFRKYLGPECQEPDTPEIKEEVELPQIKQEESVPPQQHKSVEQLPIKKEEAEDLPVMKEEEDVTRTTAEPLKSRGGLDVARTEAEGYHFIARPPDSDGIASHLFYNDGDAKDHKEARCGDSLFKCSVWPNIC
ncbi:uncharacterized protein LOC144091820 isoform X1 [Stigmatopora argus]